MDTGVMGVSSKDLAYTNILAAVMTAYEADGLGASFT